MFKKIYKSLLLMLVATLIIPMIPASAIGRTSLQKVNGEEVFLTEEFSNDEGAIKIYNSIESNDRYAEVIESNGTVSNIVFDSQTNQIFINGELYEVKLSGNVSNIYMNTYDNPQARWRNPSYGEIYQGKFDAYFPYRETVIVMAAAIAVYAPWKSVQFIAGALGGMTGLQQGVNLQYDVYRSQSSHYSSYNGVYYNRIKHKNAKLVNSSSSKHLISDSGWMDPIRPY